MRVLDAIVLLASVAASHGNVKLFMGDCARIKKRHFSICKTATESLKERKMLGKKYLHIGGC